mgnify:CR=1 FL=1
MLKAQLTKQSIRTLTATLLLSGVLSACATTQMTSGQDYLNGYAPAHKSQLASYTGNANASSDQQVRDIAAVEPTLKFPARIGLARINRHRLSNAPVAELEIWQALAEDLGPATGEFVPVSPFIADMVRPTQSKSAQHNVVADIRRASARQHLDYVLIYETVQATSQESNALSLADLTVLGLYVLPSRSVKVDSSASAILVDVRNGYPYGTATAFATAKKNTTKAGSGAYRRTVKSKTNTEAVENLAKDVKTMFHDLQRKLYAGE